MADGLADGLGAGMGEGMWESLGDAVPLRAALVESARRMGLEHPVETAKVFGSWRELVGDQVAARCDPAGLSRGVLRVWAATPTWASELHYLAPEVIRRVNAGVGATVVREVKVSVRPVPGDRPNRGRPYGRSRGAGPDDGWPRDGGRTPARAEPVARSVLPSGAALDADELVRGITDERLAAATKRALLAAKTHTKDW